MSIANLDAVRAQISGGTIYGMSAAMGEEMTVMGGAMVEGHIDKYSMLRMADVPPINAHFEALPGHERIAIVGKAPTGPIQTAIGNANLTATGNRPRCTPFIKQDMPWS